jgi:hypothetical protein
MTYTTLTTVYNHSLKYHINMYHSIRRLPGHVHMVPRQQCSVMWATRVVIKRIRVWLHHLLPPPPPPLLGIWTWSIILRPMLHVQMLVIWVIQRLRIILNNSTARPASPTPRSLNYTVCRLSSLWLSRARRSSSRSLLTDA